MVPTLTRRGGETRASQILLFSRFCGLIEGDVLPLEALDRLMVVYKNVSERAGHFGGDGDAKIEEDADPRNRGLASILGKEEAKMWFTTSQVIPRGCAASGLALQ
jgi:hypothetical protein